MFLGRLYSYRCLFLPPPTKFIFSFGNRCGIELEALYIGAFLIWYKNKFGN